MAIKPPPEKYVLTYLEPLNVEEIEMLHRIVCLGTLGGDHKTRSSLFTKIQKGYENVRAGRAWVCTRDIMEMQKAEHGKKTERV